MQVRRVWYPGLTTTRGHEYAKELFTGFGGVVSVDLEGGEEAADAFLHVRGPLSPRPHGTRTTLCPLGWMCKVSAGAAGRKQVLLELKCGTHPVPLRREPVHRSV